MGKKKNRKKRKSGEPTPAQTSGTPAVAAEKAPEIAAIKVKKSKARQKAQKFSEVDGRKSWTGVWLLLAVAILAGMAGLAYADKAGELFLLFSSPYWNLLRPVPVAVGMVLALFLARLFYQLTSSSRMAKALTGDNPAGGLCLAGFLIGVALPLIASVCYTRHEFSWDHILSVLRDGGIALLIALILLRFAAVLHDRLVLYRFSVVKEIVEDRNLGTGAVCCGAFIATGLILMGCFTGESYGWKDDLLVILAAYILGQVMFVLGGVLFQVATDYDIHHQIGERDNAAAGVIFGSFLVGLGLVVSASISEIYIAGHDWRSALVDLGFCALNGVVGMLLLLVVGIWAAKLIFPRASVDVEVRQKNSSVALVLAAVYLTVGLVVRALLLAVREIER